MKNDDAYFSEMHASDGEPRGPYVRYDAWFAKQNKERFAKKSQEAEAFFRRTGITFNWTCPAFVPPQVLV